MAGIYNENDPHASRQPPHVLAAWIPDLLREVQGAQVRSLAALRLQLESKAFEWDSAVLAGAVATLHSSGRELHFEQLRPGWLDKLLGRHREVHARFAAGYERMAACASLLKTAHAGLAAAHKGQLQSARRLLVELGMECSALQSALEQGVTWLQDMCEQIGASRGAGSDDPQLASLAEAAQAFTQEFKRLQSIATLAREIGVRGQAVLDRRTAVLEQVRVQAETFEKDWMRAVGPVAAHVRAGKTSLPGVGPAAEAHDELMRRLSVSSDSCSALQQEEHLLAQQLTQLRRELEVRR